ARPPAGDLGHGRRSRAAAAPVAAVARDDLLRRLPVAAAGDPRAAAAGLDGVAGPRRARSGRGRADDRDRGGELVRPRATGAAGGRRVAAATAARGGRAADARGGGVSRVRVAAAALLLAGPCVLAFLSGGFFDEARLWGGLVAWGLVVVGAVTAPRQGEVGRGGGGSGAARGGRPDARRAGWAAAAALAGLCAWTALSAGWAPLS